MTNSYFTYIVRCADGSLYTGITDDLELRLKEHNGEVKGGAKYTRSKRPVYLVHYENFESKSEALKREAEIKRLEKTEKEKLIIKS